MGLSQAAFAEMMGVHRRSQINYETGKRQPTLEYLEALKRVGVDLSQLMGTGEAVQTLRAAAYFHLLSKITSLLGMRGERLGYALDQALRITLDTMKMQGEEMVVDEKGWTLK
ncbi:MAG: helix-turn-helix transcriptional regulator [Thiobacillus sp.]|uniref:helix-turn-helix domain-containing protein n=1 Tax=Thiobacillus sp. TaxID=924 RepID=UPI00168C3CEC|nr:helix-turn-helix transcriptional regulator [Thiobacillus sp.]QLQ03226.1 MAG: helix-turn-helix transcriptional regulator [Thiobacillus sp.]